MFFDINTTLCEKYVALDPIKLLDYPAEDVFNLINDLIDHTERHKKENKHSKKVMKPAKDDWF